MGIFGKKEKKYTIDKCMELLQDNLIRAENIQNKYIENYDKIKQLLEKFDYTYLIFDSVWTFTAGFKPNIPSGIYVELDKLGWIGEPLCETYRYLPLDRDEQEDPLYTSKKIVVTMK